MTDTQPILNDIADYIENHGWIRYTNYGPDGSCCLLGAFMRITVSLPALTTNNVFMEIWSRIQPLLSNHPLNFNSADHGFISFYNDTLVKDVNDVLHLLRKENNAINP